MLFNTHSRLLGQHAFLSASKYHWTNYDEEKLERVYIRMLAAKRGDELHAFAHHAIRLGIRLPDVPTTLNSYVNDAIGFRMSSEQILYYSDNCFGTPDTISFRNNVLRIHDLKTGVTPTSERQLEVYAALFCLEYRVKPFAIETELRIYQSDDIRVYLGDPDTIVHIMDRIVTFDKRIEAIKRENQF
jgi:hypothetical protein